MPLTDTERLANQKASIEDADRALLNLRDRLTESERQRAILSDLLDRERSKTATLAARLDRVADVIQAARSARSSSANSTRLTPP